MKIYIALFTTLIAACHFTKVSAADATAPADGASHPHLRALADTTADAVDVACPIRRCRTVDDCDDPSSTCNFYGVTDSVCEGVCIGLCPEGECDSDGNYCPFGTTCNTSVSGSVSGCYECRADNQSAPLRASILKEE
eukprot:scaffold3120_cov219-Skeletonema_marinoi.AAC.5